MFLKAGPKTYFFDLIMKSAIPQVKQCGKALEKNFLLIVTEGGFALNSLKSVILSFYVDNYKRGSKT